MVTNQQAFIVQMIKTPRLLRILANGTLVVDDNEVGMLLGIYRVTLMDRNVNVIALVKDGERYVFLYDDESTPQLLQTLGRYAADPELNFTWYDAAVLSQKVRRLQSDSPPPEPKPFRRSA